MTLPSSGSISFSQVNEELGYPYNRQISLNDYVVRRLAMRPTGEISFGNLRGRNATTYLKIGRGTLSGKTFYGYETGTGQGSVDPFKVFLEAIYCCRADSDQIFYFDITKGDDNPPKIEVVIEGFGTLVLPRTGSTSFRASYSIKNKAVMDWLAARVGQTVKVATRFMQ